MTVETTLVILMALATLLLFMYMFWRETTRPREKPAEVYTVVKCGDGAERKRSYREGDYVGKSTDDCAGGVVVSIYKEYHAV